MGCFNGLIFGTLTTILYLSMLTSGAFRARSSYLVIFYFLMFLVPPTLASIKANKNAAVNGVLAVCLFILMYVYFRGSVTWASITWMVVTTWVISQGIEDVDESGHLVWSLVRVLLLMLLGLWFWRTEATRFADTDIPNIIQTPISSIAGITKATKQAIARRADVIVAPMAYEVDGQYIFRVAPIHPTYFTYSTYVEKGDARALNQLIGEIRLVSSVENGGSGVGAFFAGLWHGLWSMVKGIFSLIFHPVTTVKALGGFMGGIFSTAVHEPAGLIQKPYDAFREYGQSLDQELAARYEVDLANLQLPETLAALNTSRRSLVTGMAAFEIASVVIPAGKLGEAKLLGKASKAEDLLGGSEKVARETKRFSKRAAAENGELLTKDIKINSMRTKTPVAGDDISGDAGSLAKKTDYKDDLINADGVDNSRKLTKDVEEKKPLEATEQGQNAKATREDGDSYNTRDKSDLSDATRNKYGHLLDSADEYAEKQGKKVRKSEHSNADAELESSDGTREPFEFKNEKEIKNNTWWRDHKDKLIEEFGDKLSELSNKAKGWLAVFRSQLGDYVSKYPGKVGQLLAEQGAKYLDDITQALEFMKKHGVIADYTITVLENGDVAIKVIFN